MAEGRLESEWDRQSCLLAMLANIHRDTKKYPKGFSATEYNPMRKAAAKKQRGSSFKDNPEAIAPFKRMKKGAKK